MVTARHVVIVGPMAVGKTTIGRALARALGRPFLDSDVELERRTGETAAEIAARDGVETLHTVEMETFLEMVGARTPAVVAPAASVVDADEGRKALRSHFTIWLDAPERVLADRRDTGSHRRETDALERAELERRRAPWWEEIAQVRVDTNRPVSEIVDELGAELR